MTENSLPLRRALGLALLAARDGERAAEAFGTALTFEPTDGETHFNHGVALQMQHRTRDAVRAYQRALTFKPDFTAANFNLGALFHEQGATKAAVDAYESVLKAEPANAAAYRYLGEVLFGAGRIEAWLANFKRFERHCPDALSLAAQALVACQYLADFPRLEGYLEGLRSERFVPATKTICATASRKSSTCSCSSTSIRTWCCASRRRTTRRRGAFTASRRRRDAPRTPGRLRIGYLSPDLRNHVMGKMLWQAVELHDRSRFELYFYSLSTQEDEWTARFRGHCRCLREHRATVRAGRGEAHRRGRSRHPRRRRRGIPVARSPGFSR